MENNFMNMLKNEALNENYNVSYTDNGAKGFRTTGKTLVDFNFNVTNYRNSTENEIWKDFEPAIIEDADYALKYLFYLGDIRQGIGERRTFKILLRKIAENYRVLLRKVVATIPEYTRWDYILDLLNTSYRDEVLEIIRNQINEDWNNMLDGKSVSLCAKWLKSINTSSVASRKIAMDVANGLGLSAKKYRQTLSKLRKYINVVEVKMSAKEWEKIDYNTVPSKANLNYKNAFLKHDEERRTAYLEALSKGTDGVKINAKVAFPHEIIHKMGSYYSYSKDDTLEAMWKDLMTTMPENMGDMIVVADGSGSMTSNIPGSSCTNLDVAHGFAIACSEKLSGPYKNKYITFSSNPKFVDLSKCTSLYDKVREARRHTEVSNTNIQKVFELILDTARVNNLTQDELPKTVLICSDMQFDSCVVDNANSNNWRGGYDVNLFSYLQKQYEKYGYNLPKLVFLNTNVSGNKTIPITQNKLGAILLSGYSTQLMKMVMSNECDPWLALKKTLDSERYSSITY